MEWSEILHRAFGWVSLHDKPKKIAHAIPPTQNDNSLDLNAEINAVKSRYHIKLTVVKLN